MNIFIVERFGIYQQGTFGAFARQEDAQLHADHLARTDYDEWHEYVVTRYTLDAAIPAAYAGGAPVESGSEIVYRVNHDTVPVLA